jgi:hypothetical protein
VSCQLDPWRASTQRTVNPRRRLHAEAAQLRGWVHAAAAEQEGQQGDPGASINRPALDLRGAWPYWLEREAAVANDYPGGDITCVAGEGGAAPPPPPPPLTLLTAPNMSGKSTLLRTVAASCLLANCGLSVPAAGAVVPVFDTIFLRNAAFDAPEEGKSSFGAEMAGAQGPARCTPPALPQRVCKARWVLWCPGATRPVLKVVWGTAGAGQTCATCWRWSRPPRWCWSTSSGRSVLRSAAVMLA